MNKFNDLNGKINGMTQCEFEAEFYRRNPPGSLAVLKNKTAAIAGAGGLGSNVAAALIRGGVYNLIIADFDMVELSNLNRQQFFYDQIGVPKVSALKENLLKINPFVTITAVAEKICESNVKEIFGGADILIEAFDRAEMKAMLIETWCAAFPDKFIVAASGLAGTGRGNAIKAAVYGRLVLCGDQTTEANEANGLIAPRVAMAAALEANCAVEILLNGGIGN